MHSTMKYGKAQPIRKIKPYSCRLYKRLLNMHLGDFHSAAEHDANMEMPYLEKGVVTA